MDLMVAGVGVLSLLLAGPPPAPSDKAKELPLREPIVRSVFPMGGQAGRRVLMEIEGDFLDRASAIRCECDDLTGNIRKANAVRLQAEIELPARAAAGPRTIYVETPRGTSNRFLFRVTGWNSVAEQEPNDLLVEAQRVTTPVVLEGRISRLTDADFYRFHAGAGERLAFNLMGARSKAPGFVAITLLSGAGHEMAHNNSRIGPDAYLDYTFAEAGDYYAVVTPRRFADFFTVVKDDQVINWQYQLAIGRGPMLWSVFPMGGRRGTTVEAELRADFLPPNRTALFSGKGLEAELGPAKDSCECKHKLTVRIAEDADPGVHYLTVPDISGNATALGFLVTDSPEILETDSKPQPVALPVTVNGRIGSPGDRGVFRLKVNQDDEVTFVVDARGLGSRMTDPQLILMRATGEIVDSADDRCRKCSGFDSTVRKKELLDAKLTHAFISASANDADAAGEYDIVLLDNSSRGGDDQTYRLTIRKKQPQFQIGVMADHVNGRIGDAVRIPVGIAREEGFQEDVEVSARNLPPGWSAKPLVIANGHDKGELEVRREDGSATAGSLEIAGNSQLAVVPPLLTEDGLGYLETPRTKVSVSFVESPLFSLRIEEPFSGFVIDRKGAARIEIAVGVDRAKGFDGELTFGLEDLPDGVAVSEQAPEHLWIRTDPQIVKPGRYRIAARATAKYQGREATEVSAGIRLQVK